jgi:hypothetical protein
MSQRTSAGRAEEVTLLDGLGHIPINPRVVLACNTRHAINLLDALPFDPLRTA